MLGAKEIESVNKKQIANIIAKLKSGKVLTRREHELIEKNVKRSDGIVSITEKVERGEALTEEEKANIAKGNAVGLTKVPTKVALAKLFSVNRKTIESWSRLDGAPTPSSAGKHDVLKWAKFILDKKLTGKRKTSSEPVSLNDRKLSAQCEKIEAEVEIVKGNWISRSEVATAAEAIVDALIQAIEQFAVPYELKQTERRVKDDLRNALKDEVRRQSVFSGV